MKYGAKYEVGDKVSYNGKRATIIEVDENVFPYKVQYESESGWDWASESEIEPDHMTADELTELIQSTPTERGEAAKLNNLMTKEDKMLHVIKIQEPYADAIIDGRKTFEVRLNDRGYNSGDKIQFKVIYQDGRFFDSHPLNDRRYQITYVHSGLGMAMNYVVFGIKEVKE